MIIGGVTKRVFLIHRFPKGNLTYQERKEVKFNPNLRGVLIIPHEKGTTTHHRASTTAVRERCHAKQPLRDNQVLLLITDRLLLW